MVYSLLLLYFIQLRTAVDTATGSDRSNNPFDGNSEAIVADSWGVQTTIELSEDLVLSGWAGFTHAIAIDLSDRPTANIFNWAATFAFPDLGKQASVLGFVVGQPPKATQNDFQPDGQAYADSDTSLHLQAFYRFRLNEFLSFTPGILIVTDPNHDHNNDTLYVGTLRTTFSF